MKASKKEIRKIRLILQYQYRNTIHDIDCLIPDNIEIIKSNKTKRIKQVLLDNNPLFYYRPMDGLFVPAKRGAERLHEQIEAEKFRVIINKDAEPFIRKGKTAFAKHILEVDSEIKIGDEVLILNPEKLLIGWGDAILPGRIMREMRAGVAVKTRGGIKTKNKQD